MVRPVVIGNVSGATGDRQEAMVQMLSGGHDVDAIVGDWLSEMNLPWRAFDFFADNTKGYEIPFLYSFRLAAERFVTKNVKLVVNAGAFNPRQLAVEAQKILNETLTLDGAKAKIVAWLEGDNVHSYCESAPDKFIHLHNGTTLKDWGKVPITANAYLGAWGIVKALEEGADIVITGRVTDASPVIGVAAWWHNWQQDEFDKLAHALAAGHLVECGPYVTGGNFPGFKRLMPNYFNLSHPIVEINSDGTSVITKQPNQNGLVTLETVKTQFLYELQGPMYFNPDVVADLTNITFTSVGVDRVRVSNVRGLPAPPTLKVAVQAHGGHQGEISVHPVGLDIQEKFESFKIMSNMILKEDIEKGNISVLEYQLYGSVMGDPTSQEKATVQMRIFIQAETAEMVSKATRLILTNSLSAFPGLTYNMDLRTAQPKPFLEFWPGLVPRSFAPQKIHFPHKTLVIRESSPFLTPSNIPKQLSYEPTSPIPLSHFGPTVRAPLGHIVYARSGDKGPNVNVGFFCSGESAAREQVKWDWLRSFLTISRIKYLLGENNSSASKIERCEFPHIRAVHVVIHGILGSGVGSTSKLDSLGKGVAEYLRARMVDIPSSFYDSRTKL